MRNNHCDNNRYRGTLGGSHVVIGIMQPAARALVRLTADMLYKRNHDGALKAALRSSKSVSECLAEGSSDLSLAWRKVLEADAEKRKTDQNKGTNDVMVVDPNTDTERSIEQVHSVAFDSLGNAEGWVDLTHIDRMKTMAAEDEFQLSKFESEAVARVSEFTELMVEDMSVEAMAANVRNTTIGKLRGEGTKYVLIAYTPRLASEYATQSHIRVPPLRTGDRTPGGPHYNKLISAILKSRSAEVDVELDDGDCYLVSDSGKSMHFVTLMNAFVDNENKNLPKSVKSLQVFYDEED